LRLRARVDIVIDRTMRSKRLSFAVALIGGSILLPAAGVLAQPEEGAPTPAASSSAEAPASPPTSTPPVPVPSVAPPVAPPVASSTSASPVAAPPVTVPPARAPPGTFSRLSIVSGSVVTFVGLLLLFDSGAKEGKLDAVCVADPSTGVSSCPPSAASAIKSFDTELAVGGIGTLVGIALLTIGYFAYDPADAPPAPASAFTLHLSPGGVRGTF
jgi:hypothetical protein